MSHLLTPREGHPAAIAFARELYDQLKATLAIANQQHGEAYLANRGLLASTSKHTPDALRDMYKYTGHIVFKSPGFVGWRLDYRGNHHMRGLLAVVNPNYTHYDLWAIDSTGGLASLVYAVAPGHAPKADGTIPDPAFFHDEEQAILTPDGLRPFFEALAAANTAWPAAVEASRKHEEERRKTAAAALRTHLSAAN